MSSVTEKAYAKINLGLKILDQRADGFHNILSVMETVSLCDTLRLVTKPDGIDVRCSGVEGVPEGEENLAYKAAALVKKKYAVKEGVEITIRKRIPVGAGLGGGSSDAAAVLRGLNRLWNLQATWSELLSLASSIGSDVPFLLRKGTAIVSGRGDVLEYLSSPISLVYVIVYPGFSISTEWAYKKRKNNLTSRDEYVNFVFSLKRGVRDIKLLSRSLKNDFEQIVEERYPLIREVRERLLSAGAMAASLSGSGSAVYGLFGDSLQAEQAIKRLMHPQWEVFICHSVS